MNEQNWKQDSDMIFTQITSAAFDDYKSAEKAAVLIYAFDMTVSRAGISHALGRLERHYKNMQADTVITDQGRAGEEL